MAKTNPVNTVATANRSDANFRNVNWGRAATSAALGSVGGFAGTLGKSAATGKFLPADWIGRNFGDEIVEYSLNTAQRTVLGAHALGIGGLAGGFDAYARCDSFIGGAAMGAASTFSNIAGAFFAGFSMGYTGSKSQDNR